MTEKDIIKAVEDAETFSDSFGLMLEHSKEDPGTPFRPDNLAQLLELRRDNPSKYETVRSQLKSVGVRVSELDQHIKKGERSEDTAVNGSILDWPDEDPWPEPVDGAELLDEIVSVFKRYLVLPAHAAEAMAIWVIHSHALDASYFAPRLALLSPEKRCGKTTTLSVLHDLVRKPLPASNITPAALFRSIDLACPTLLIDEADTFLKDKDELRGILNSGHQRAQAFVLRVAGDDHTPVKFSTWTSISIAMIGKLPETLADRSIVIPLARKKPEDKVENFRSDNAGQFAPLKQKIVRWVEDNFAALRSWDGEVPSELHDRAKDNWRPLLAIADTAGGHWPDTARSAARGLSKNDDESSASVELLVDIKQIFETRDLDRMPTNEILSELHDIEERRWSDWRKGKPLNPSQFARMVKPFGVSPGSIRLEQGRTAKGYKLGDFEDAFSRYLPAQAGTPSQPAESVDLGQYSAVTPEKIVPAKISPNPKVGNGCDVVPANMLTSDEKQDNSLDIPSMFKRT